MAYAHAEYMTETEARDVILPILQKRFKAYGFRKAEFGEEETFDGSSIFRVVAFVTEKVPAVSLLDALDAIHSTLRKKGEERFVFLSTKIPGEEIHDDDEDVE